MKRLISALILVLVLALPVVFGPAWVLLIMAVIVIPMCIFELMRVCLSKDARLLGWIVFYASFPFLWFTYRGNLSAIYCIMIGMSLAVMGFGLYLYEHEKASAREMGLALSTIIYPLTLFSFWILVRNGIDGRFWMIFGLLCTFLSDAGAYYTGKNLGKMRLSPRLSPKKTWEGLLGGIAVSIVSGIVFTLIYAQIVPLQGTYPLWLIVVLGFAIAVLDLMGDLTASMFKREFDVKDMGSLIPGHGGMLDRMDGVIPVGAALYIIIQVLR